MWWARCRCSRCGGRPSPCRRPTASRARSPSGQTRPRSSTSPSTSTRSARRRCFPRERRRSTWAWRPGCSAPRSRSTRSSSRRPRVTFSTNRSPSIRGRWSSSARDPRNVCSTPSCRSTPNCVCWAWTRRPAAWISRSWWTRTAATAVSSPDSRSSSVVIDLRLLRASPQQVRAALARRGDSTVTRLLDELEALDMRRRALTGQLDQLKAERNEAAKADARLTKEKGALPPDVRESRRALGERIDGIEAELKGVEQALEQKLLHVPNLPLPDLPDGDASHNKIVRTWGEPAPKGGKPHWEIGEQLGILDLARGAKLSGSGFPVFVGAGSKLGRALINFMLDRHAEAVLQRLELSYRVVLLAAGDLGFASAKTYDLEVWAPGVGQWLEVSSSSTFTDFQARRANIRYRPSAGAKPELAHTLNASGVALPRTIAALLETRQQPDGSVTVPAALVPYLGMERLVPPPPSAGGP